MPTRISRAGLMLGALGIACAVSARADDFRPTQALLESGLFLGQAEADAVYARLDAPRAAAPDPIPGSAAYWESGAVGVGQAERAGRLGWGGDATQMRLGVDRDLGSGVIVGSVAGAAFGGLGSGDLAARTVSRHADVYARVGGGSLFAKGLVGASSFSFDEIARAGCRADATGYGLRAGGQVGGVVRIASVKFTPTLALTATGHALDGYRESGEAAAVFSDRRAAMASGTVRLAGTRSVALAPTHKVDLTAFVGADEVLAFGATALRARAAGASVTAPTTGAPNGRGVFGGVGLATMLVEGVSLTVDYDYGLRDGVSTRSGKARVGVSF